MNLIENFPFRKGLSSKIIKERLKQIEKGQRNMKMQMLYNLIAYCELEDFLEAVKDYNICPSYFYMQQKCIMNNYPRSQKQLACKTCWENSICDARRPLRFGNAIIDKYKDYILYQERR